MKLKLIFSAIVFVGLIYSCSGDGDKPSKETLIERITEMEDSLKGLQANLKEIKQIPNLTHFELINRLLDYYHAYPEDEYAAVKKGR